MWGRGNLLSEPWVVVRCGPSGARWSIGEYGSTFHTDQATGFLPVSRLLILDHAAMRTGGIGWGGVLAGRRTGLLSPHNKPPVDWEDSLAGLGRESLEPVGRIFAPRYMERTNRGGLEGCGVCRKS